MKVVSMQVCHTYMEKEKQLHVLICLFGGSSSFYDDIHCTIALESMPLYHCLIKLRNLAFSLV